MFPDSDLQKVTNYLRQLLFQMRRTIGLEVVRATDSSFTWPSDVRADSTDLQFERALIEARSVNGEERLARLRNALRSITGTYLPASDLEWVVARRYQLDLLEEEAVAEIADLALRLSDYDAAREFGERLLARNPHNQNAYRILIDVETAVGTKTAAVALDRKAVAALREIGLDVDADASLTMSSLIRQ